MNRAALLSLSHDDLIALILAQDAQIEAQGRQISGLTARLAELGAKLAAPGKKVDLGRFDLFMTEPWRYHRGVDGGPQQSHRRGMTQHLHGDGFLAYRRTGAGGNLHLFGETVLDARCHAGTAIARTSGIPGSTCGF